MGISLSSHSSGVCVLLARTRIQSPTLCCLMCTMDRVLGTEFRDIQGGNVGKSKTTKI